MPRKGVIWEGVAARAKVRPRPDLELVAGLVIRKDCEAWHFLNLCWQSSRAVIYQSFKFKEEMLAANLA